LVDWIASRAKVTEYGNAHYGSSTGAYLLMVFE
jgi:hypothetical protein